MVERDRDFRLRVFSSVSDGPRGRAYYRVVEGGLRQRSTGSTKEHSLRYSKRLVTTGDLG